jgi:hypothetical protein
MGGGAGGMLESLGKVGQTHYNSGLWDRPINNSSTQICLVRENMTFQSGAWCKVNGSKAHDHL